VPPFDKMAPPRSPPRSTLGVELRGAELEAIVTDPAPATFANTMVPLENAGRHLTAPRRCSAC
jgi:peptidyl-dipeptidase Dcp